MFCPNCGQQLPDGSKFCGSCGSPLNVAPAGAENPSANPNYSNPGANGGPAAPPPGIKPQFETEKKKKKFPLKAVIIAAAAVVVVIIAIVVIIAVAGKSKKSDNAYVYLSDGSYELLTSLKKGTTIEISSSKSDDFSTSLVRFSSDGTYVYYYTKYDSSTYCGTLCKAEYAKLKDGSSKNDKYIEIIATNVELGFSMIGDDELLFTTADDTLYYYDGDEAISLAKDVSYYYSDDGTRVMYYTYEDDYTYSIYGINLKDTDTLILLADGCDYIYNFYDLDNIFYGVEDDNYNETLYVVGMDSDSVELGSGLYSYYTYSSGTFYYALESGESINLYDYVIDDYASSDANITEPDLEDYEIVNYSYYKLYSDDYEDIDEYGEIYTSCTNAISFYSSGWFYRSMEYAAENSDEYGEYYQTFIDKYLDQEDSNGYIVVTDEIIDDLITLVTACGGESTDWVACCFYKEENGTTYDYDTYYDDRDLWYSAEDRIELRQELQSSENAYALKTIYSYSDGTATAVAENVVTISTESGCLFFNTVDSLDTYVNIEDISSVYEVTSSFYASCAAGEYLLIYSTGETALISETTEEIYANLDETGYPYFYSYGDYTLLVCSEGPLYEVSISGGEITSMDLISDDASIISIDDDVIYYFSEIYDSNYYSYADLYSYDGKESTRLAQDIMTYYATVYSDGVLLVYTDVDTYDYDYELTMIDSKGSSTVIDDEVSIYVRTDSDTILYIANDNLYYYNGEESTLISRNVDYFWTLSSVSYIRSYYDY